MSVNKTMLRWLRLNSQESRYYIPKAIDLFLCLPETHQKLFVEHFADGLAMSKWQDKVHDPTHYVELVRSILFYYSGRPGTPSPGRSQFVEELARLIRSSVWTDAIRETVESVDPELKATFTTELGAL